jgi:hypothetical protein
MGATEKRAADALVELGADVRVAFDARTTKLHAKAWLLERSLGLSTAFVGSSNLSHSEKGSGMAADRRCAAVGATAAHVLFSPKVPTRYSPGGSTVGAARLVKGRAKAFGRDPIAAYIQREGLRQHSPFDQRGHG